MYFNCFSYAYENKDDYLHCSTDEKLFAMLQRLAVFSQSGKGRNRWPGQTPKPKFCQKLQGRDINPPPLAGTTPAFLSLCFRCVFTAHVLQVFPCHLPHMEMIFLRSVFSGMGRNGKCLVTDVRSLSSC